jgi:hypothetical protein
MLSKDIKNWRDIHTIVNHYKQERETHDGLKIVGYENDQASDRQLILANDKIKLSFDPSNYYIKLPKNGHPKFEENKAEAIKHNIEEVKEQFSKGLALANV